jgi:hypothetical protein
MRNMKGGKLIAAVVAIVSFTAIVWVSCKKSDKNLNTCNYYVCLNGGYCHRDAITQKVGCLCPTGYEGNNCSIKSVDKFIGTWNMEQIITGSDSMDFQNDTMYYLVMLKKSATPTTFFISNFSANPYYEHILCTMDTGDSRYFNIDTMSAKQLFYDHFHLVKGSGSIINDTIRASLITRHLSTTSNWIRDTFAMTMTRHKF